MKRLTLFEFEDFDWLPNVVRTGITNLIVVFHKMMGTSDVIANLILELKQHHNFSQIVDLGSGSGGPMLEVIEKVNAQSNAEMNKLILSDLHPNPTLVDKISDLNLPNVSYHRDSVDATNIAKAPDGLKTMIASFHHMNPDTARKILHSAQDNKEAILIYELAKNNIPVIVWCLLLPLSLLILVVMSLVMTLFVRPVSLSQLLFTYLIPIIPLIYAWDGQASLMRTYTFEDVEELIGDMDSPDYKWTVADATKANGKKLGYYIMGYPK